MQGLFRSWTPLPAQSVLTVASSDAARLSTGAKIGAPIIGPLHHRNRPAGPHSVAADVVDASASVPEGRLPTLDSRTDGDALSTRCILAREHAAVDWLLFMRLFPSGIRESAAPSTS